MKIDLNLNTKFFVKHIMQRLFIPINPSSFQKMFLPNYLKWKEGLTKYDVLPKLIFLLTSSLLLREIQLFISHYNGMNRCDISLADDSNF